MPELTKAQKKLIDKIRDCSSIVILSKYSRNPYLYEYFVNAKPRVSRIPDRVFNSLQDNRVFESVEEKVREECQVEMQLNEYYLREYIEKSKDEV